MVNLNVRLSCRHTTTISHTTHADAAYCRFHGWEDIAYIWFEEWRVACLLCTYGAWTKDSRVGAERRAAKHTHDRGEAHKCVVIRDDKIKPKTRVELREDYRTSLITDPEPYTLDVFGNSTNPDDPPPF